MMMISWALRLFLVVALTINSSVAQQQLQNGTIGQEMKKIHLAGIFDLTTYDWGYAVFAVAVNMINDNKFLTNGILPADTTLEYSLANSNCNSNAATQAFFELEEEMDAIVGARCSSASITLAQLGSVHKVPQVSIASNSNKLSSDADYPYFSRMVAPNDETGEVGGLITFLRSFGWQRVITIATEKAFSQDIATEFRKAWTGSHDDDSGSWEGEVSYSVTIRLNTDINETVDEATIQQALAGIPVDEPRTNSRIILLFAHSQHAFKILEVASVLEFQPDSIWVGPSSWAGRGHPGTDFSFLSDTIPGYFGIGMFRNQDAFMHQSFLQELQEYEQSQGKPLRTSLPVFAGELVDSIVALTMAISQTDDPSDGAAVVKTLRQLDFYGVTGRVQFNEIGDRKDVQYEIYNAQYQNDPTDIVWTSIGTVGTAVGSFDGTSTLCFAEAGCSLEEPPGDTYPVPPAQLPLWILILVGVIAALLVCVIIRYSRSTASKRKIKEELESFRTSLVGMRAAECNYMPKARKWNVTPAAVETVMIAMEQPKDDASDDSSTIDTDQVHSSKDFTPIPAPAPVIWCWKETPVMMKTHSPSTIYGSPNDCWIKYKTSVSKGLEEAYQANNNGKFSPLSGYVVDFGHMTQTKIASSYERDIIRVQRQQQALATAAVSSSVRPTNIDLSNVKIGDELPRDLTGEPQMVLVTGDVVQISKNRNDGWAFGSKLHHANEEEARQLSQYAHMAAGFGGGASSSEQDNFTILTDAGWFQLKMTRVPLAQDLAALKAGMGAASAGALATPSHWAPIRDRMVVQTHALNSTDKEYMNVKKAFLSSLQNTRVDLIKVERVQNVAMWQSYIVKRQTVCFRETGNNDLQSMEKYERKWLWHGSNRHNATKILQQGFNRSFCGKNATMYGKGVYFAKNASYSAQTLYAVPESNGNQVVLACRVVVGEYSQGKQNALTPDVRDAATHSLYDTTVDRVKNPSIYVTYHDSQAYPEYVLTFRRRK